MTTIAPEKVEVRERVELDPRVRRGAAFLDEWEDGWAQKIDLSKFAMQSVCRCVLGQIRGNFWEACSHYGYDSTPTASGWAAELGFSTEGWTEAYAALERDWVTLIRERQAEHECS